jgi:hypothetical protein
MHKSILWILMTTKDGVFQTCFRSENFLQLYTYRAVKSSIYLLHNLATGSYLDSELPIQMHIHIRIVLRRYAEIEQLKDRRNSRILMQEVASIPDVR